MAVQALTGSAKQASFSTPPILGVLTTNPRRGYSAPSGGQNRGVPARGHDPLVAVEERLGLGPVRATSSQKPRSPRAKAPWSRPERASSIEGSLTIASSSLPSDIPTSIRRRLPASCSSKA
jgi:hypothetical protein